MVNNRCGNTYYPVMAHLFVHIINDFKIMFESFFTCILHALCLNHGICAIQRSRIKLSRDYTDKYHCYQLTHFQRMNVVKDYLLSN